MANEKGREEYATYTVLVLKELLRERGLPVSGNKPDLIERLLEDDARIYTEVLKKASEPEAEVVEVAEPQERKCDTCKKGFVPAKPKFTHCPSCHARWQFEQDFPRVEGKLEGAKKAFGRYNDYGPASVTFEEAKAYFIGIEGNFEAALAALRAASVKTDKITSQGSLDYARQLIAEAEENGVSMDEEIAKLADDVETALSGSRPWQAARPARKLRDLLRPLVGEIREAKDRRKRAKFVGAPVREIIPSDTREALMQLGRERGRQQQRTKRESGSRPRREPYQRPSPGEMQQLAEQQLAEGEGGA